MTSHLGQTIGLLAASPIHSKWSVADVARLIRTPLVLGQARLFYDNGRGPVGFVSWAYLTPKARDGFLNRTRKLNALDWNAGDELWFIDLIAPYGHMKQIHRQLREMSWRTNTAHWARSYGTGKVQKIGVVNVGTKMGS